MFSGSIFSFLFCSCKQIKILQWCLIQSIIRTTLLEFNHSKLTYKLLVIFWEMKVVILHCAVNVSTCRSCVLYIYTVNSCCRFYIYVVSNICYFLSTSKHTSKSQRVSAALKGCKKWILAWNGLMKFYFPVGIYMFKVSYRNTRKMCEIGSKLTTKTLEHFIVNFKQISHLVLVFLLLTLNM